MGLKSKKTANECEAVAAVGDGMEQDTEFVGAESDEGQTAGTRESEELAALKAEVLDLRDKYLRALADFENFRKRSQKERSDLLKYQGEYLVVDLLEVKDSFERALENPGSDLEKFKEGVRLIDKQFADVLGKWDVRGESSIGKEFDPNRHRAIGKAKVEGQKPNTVIGELKRPYLYKDKLIRVGEVMVSEAPAESSTDAASEGTPEGVN
jgi:molecular chaperone GrpE